MSNSLWLLQLGIIIHSKQVILRMTSATIVDLNWNNIDKITFSTYGRLSAASSSSAHFALDNLCVTTKCVSFEIINLLYYIFFFFHFSRKERPEPLYKCD
jgi:hypothetical protein